MFQIQKNISAELKKKNIEIKWNLVAMLLGAKKEADSSIARKKKQNQMLQIENLWFFEIIPVFSKEQKMS